MPLHAAAGIECRVNYEFREADTIARRASWTDVPGVYLGEQVKSNGVYGKDKDGVRRRKPNNSSQYTDGGGVAQFASCTGYGTMAMIFVKSRFKDEESDEIVRTIWQDVGCGKRMLQTWASNLWYWAPTPAGIEPGR